MFHFDSIFWFICVLIITNGWLAITLLLRNIEELGTRVLAQRTLNVIMFGFILIVLCTAFYPNTFAESGIIVSQR